MIFCERSGPTDTKYTLMPKYFSINSIYFWRQSPVIFAIIWRKSPDKRPNLPTVPLRYRNRFDVTPLLDQGVIVLTAVFRYTNVYYEI